MAETKLDFSDVVYRILIALGIGLGVAMVLLICYLTVKSATASGEDVFCYTEMQASSETAPQYKLYAWRDWRTNRQIGVFPTVEDAKKAADVLGCPIGRHR